MLNDVTFVRQVTDGNVSLVTVTAVGGQATCRGETVTPQNARAGLRVVRGPDWTFDDQDGAAGEAGNTGVLVRPTRPGHTDCWFVKWTNKRSGELWYETGRNSNYRLSVATAAKPAFALADVTALPVIQVELVSSGAKESFELRGDVEERVTKMLAWLPQNGLALSGGKAKDFVEDEGSSGQYPRWARQWVFTRADLPF